MYFHTYSDESCPWRDAELVKRLKPTNHVVEAGLKHRGHSPLTVLKLIRDDPDPPSFLILTRFDILYKSSILETLPPTNDDAGWNKVWLAWRDIPDKWRDYRMVSDLFFLLPTEKLHNFTRAYLKASLIERRHYPAPTGSGHAIYAPLLEERFEVDFLDPDYFGQSTTTPDNFITIDRVPTSTFDACPWNATSRRPSKS